MVTRWGMLDVMSVTVRFGIGGLKYALDLAGYKGGPVRAPLREPNEEARAEIKRLLEESEVVATREA